MEVHKPAVVMTSKREHGFKRLAESNLMKSQWRLLVIALVIMDIFMISTGFLLAYIVRFTMNIPFFYANENNLLFGFYLIVGSLLLPVWIFTFRLYGLYSTKENLGKTYLFAKLFSATTIPMFVVIVVDFFFQTFIVARGWLLLIWVFVYLLTVLGRLLIQTLIHHLRKKGYFLIPTIIVGGNQEACLLAGQFQNELSSGLHLLGFIADDIKV